MSTGFPDFDFPAPPVAVPSGRNILRTGLAWLTEQLKVNASESITYSRYYDLVEIKATLGSKLLRIEDGLGGSRVEWTDLDFLIAADDLDFGDGPITPERGDLIFWAIGADVQTFEVGPVGSEPAWRYSDPCQSIVRVHAKWIATEPYQ